MINNTLGDADFGKSHEALSTNLGNKGRIETRVETRMANGKSKDEYDAALHAVGVLIRYLGDDPSREGLIDTPKRVLAWLDEVRTTGEEPFVGTTFDEVHDDLVIVRGIPFTSLCEHHLLQFSGTAAVGYIPSVTHIGNWNGQEYVDPKDAVASIRSKGLLGLSKLARAVRVRSSRLTNQERMTREIAELVQEMSGSQDVAVTTRAEHSCMVVRGVKAHGSDTIVSSMLGAFRKDRDLRAEFLGLIR